MVKNPAFPINFAVFYYENRQCSKVDSDIWKPDVVHFCEGGHKQEGEFLWK